MSVYYDTDWDISAYRQAHESEEHWRLKRDFMEAHKGTFPEDRLVCLAQVYQNIELLGCRYPDQTMRQVAELSRGLSLDYKESKKHKLQRTFVKASDAAEARAKGTKKMKYDDPNKDSTSNRGGSGSVYHGQSREGAGLLPEPTWQYNRGSGPNQNQLNTGSALGDKMRGLIPVPPKQNTLHSGWQPGMSSMAACRPTQGNANLQRPRQENTQQYNPSLSNWNQAGPSAASQPIPGTINKRLLAMIQKYENAIMMLNRSGPPKATPPVQNPRGLMATSRKSQPQLNSTSGPGLSRGNATANPATEYLESNHPLSQLVIIQREYSKQPLNALNVLQGSASFCSVPLSYNWNPITNVCSVTVNGVQVAAVEGTSKKDARMKVASKALNELIKHCYTIRILRLHDTEEHVSPQSVETGAGKQASLDKPLEDNSMGSKLLKLMGWTGGGLGKEGKGITEPVRPVQIFGRDGLGRNTDVVGQEFKDKIHRIVRDYAYGPGLGDLTFSKEFTKEQRVEIHKISHQYKLKSTSHGRNQNRYLVLSRKVTANHLLRTLLEKGPTDKYEVIPPTRM